jgi:hypothetical protein
MLLALFQMIAGFFWSSSAAEPLLTTKGNQIVDKLGNKVVFKGIGWYGFDTGYEILYFQKEWLSYMEQLTINILLNLCSHHLQTHCPWESQPRRRQRQQGFQDCCMENTAAGV